MKRYSIYLIVAIFSILSACKGPQPIGGGDKDKDKDEVDVEKMPGFNVFADPTLPRFRVRYDHNGKFENFDKKPKDEKVKAEDFKSDTHVNSLMDSKLENIRYTNTNIEKINGYRILLYTGSDLDQAKAQELKLRNDFGNAFGKTELKYEAPNYVLKVGKFYSRLKAHEVYTNLKEEFPEAIVINEIIDLNRNRFLED